MRTVLHVYPQSIMSTKRTGAVSEPFRDNIRSRVSNLSYIKPEFTPIQAQHETVDEAMILAAGLGQRLKSIADIKPLARLLGMPLIARQVRCFERAGVKRIIIVAGEHLKLIQAELEKDSKIQADLVFVENLEGHKKNGLSLYRGMNEVHSSRFFLSMADHVFDPTFLKQAASLAEGSEGLCLYTDTDIDGVFDLNDATKVLSTSRHIDDIGKSLIRYNRIDTGLFLIQTSMLKQVFASCTNATAPNISVSEVVRGFVDREQAFAIDLPKDAYWQDVDTPASFAHAQKVCLSKQIKDTDTWTSKYLNRPISLKISQYLLKTELRPNHVTLLSFLVGMVSIFFLIRGDYWGFLLGALAYHASSVLDGCDGEVARLKMMESLDGQWIDTIADTFTHFFFVVGLMIGAYRQSENIIYVYTGCLAMILVAVLLLFMFRYIRNVSGSGSLLAVSKAFESANKGSSAYLAKCGMFLRPILRRANFALLFVLIAVFNQLPTVLFFICLAPIVALVLMTVSIDRFVHPTRDS